MIYGYARVSTPTQNIERQLRNIQNAYPGATIYKEVYTGTKYQGREVFERLIKRVKNNDTIVFDSVSRMSRNAEEGFKIYEELFEKKIELVFLKEPHINTSTYRKALATKVPTTGSNVDLILEGVNAYLMVLAKEQIKIAFEQAQKEVDDLHKRTSEGIKTAKLNGKQIGRVPGRTYPSKKKKAAIPIFIAHCKHYYGTLNIKQCAKLAGINPNTYTCYKEELTDIYNKHILGERTEYTELIDKELRK